MRILRLLLRLITLVLALAAVFFVLSFGFWYIWQDARGRGPQTRYTITTAKLGRALLGLYLKYRAEDVARVARPGDASEITFVVEPGEGVGAVAIRLERMNLITDSELFRRLVQYWGADQDIQAGVYVLRPNMTMEEIIGELQHGRVPSVKVTIPEGWRAEQIAALLEELEVTSAQGFLDAVARGSTAYDFLRDRPAGASPSAEGFLFPDTYELPRNAPPERILDILLQNWATRVTPEWRAKVSQTGMTLYEVVTLASIVEREAVVASERPLIAGVYLNRLDKGMYLQADPTVQYAKGYDPVTKRWWSPMKQEEAQTVVSRYNTFLYPGLPPGPICNPGLAAIQAVLQPEPSEYLYFYAKGDGSHVFAKTYEEHLRNEQLYGGR